MPRSLSSHAGVGIGADEINKRPKLAAKVGAVAAAWAAAEMNLTGLLAELASSDAKAALAIMSRFSTASARSQAVRAIAKAVIHEAQLAKLLVVLRSFESLANERNDVLHGLWGTTPSEPEGLIWANPLDQIGFIRTLVDKLKTGRLPDEVPFPMRVYEAQDFDQLISKIKQLNSDLTKWMVAAKMYRESGGLMPLNIDKLT